VEEELLEAAGDEDARELGVGLEETEGVDSVAGDCANVTGVEDAGLLDGGVGEKVVEVLAPELDAAFDGVECFVGGFVDVGEDSTAGSVSGGGAGGVGVEDAEGTAGGVAGHGEGVAAGERDAEALF